MEMGQALDEQGNKMRNDNKILGGITIEWSEGGGGEAAFYSDWENLPLQISGETGKQPCNWSCVPEMSITCKYFGKEPISIVS